MGVRMKSLILLKTLQLIGRLPLPVCHSMGEIFGALMYWIPNRNRKDSRINIELCFPHKSAKEKSRLVRRSLTASAKTFLEMPGIWRGKSCRCSDIMDSGTSVQKIQSLLARGKGLIIAAPHLGNWEAAASLLATVAPLTVLYRPPRMKELENYIIKGRNANGAKLAATNARGVKTLFKSIKKGEIVAILPDQEPKSGGKEAGIFAPFFNTPASTMVLLNRLATKTGAPVLYVYVKRIKGRFGYEFCTLDAPPDIHHPDPLIAATALNKGVENCILQCPEQYQWSYRRFRERQDGEDSRYM